MGNRILVRVIFSLLRDRSKLLVKKFQLEDGLENEIDQIEAKIKNREKYIKELLHSLKEEMGEDLYVYNSIKIIELEVFSFDNSLNTHYKNAVFDNTIDLKEYPMQHIVFDIISSIRGDNINSVVIVEKLGKSAEKIKYYIWRYLSQNRVIALEKDDIISDWNVISSNFNSLYKSQVIILKIAVVIKYMILYYLNINFNNNYERKVAHYTSVDVGVKLINKRTKMRLNTTEFMNDPSEGEILFDFLNLSKKTDLYNERIYHLSFVSCFTFNHNSLNQFRLYGRTNFIECSGLSLTFKNSFFYDKRNGGTATNLYRCIYLDPKTGYVKIASRNIFSFYQEYNDKKHEVKSKRMKYFKMIQMKEEIVGDLLDLLFKLRSKSRRINEFLPVILEPANLLVKHCAFADEDECRIIYQHFIEDEEVKYFEPNNTTYIEYSNDVEGHINNIYIGSSAKDLETFIRLTVAKQNWVKQPKITVNDSPYKAHSKIDRITVD